MLKRILAAVAAMLVLAGLVAAQEGVNPFTQAAPRHVRERVMSEAKMNPEATIQPADLIVQPAIAQRGIVNGVSFVYDGYVAAGEVVTVFGAQMSSATASFSTQNLPMLLGGVEVLFDGVSAPLYYVSPGQINLQVPYTVRQGTNTQIVVHNMATSQRSAPATMAVTSVRPALYSANGAPYVFNAVTWQLVGTQGHSPLMVPSSGSAYIVLYAIGLGPTTPVVSAGTVTDQTYHYCQYVVSAKLGGVSLYTQFAGLSPGYVGLYQINLQVPSTVPAGTTAIPKLDTLELTVNGVSVPSFTVAVARQ